MKKKVMNIRPQEVTENGERSVRYKGSDGKMHEVTPEMPGDLCRATEMTEKTQYNVTDNGFETVDQMSMLVDELIEIHGSQAGTEVFVNSSASVSNLTDMPETAVGGMLVSIIASENKVVIKKGNTSRSSFLSNVFSGLNGIFTNVAFFNENTLENITTLISDLLPDHGIDIRGTIKVKRNILRLTVGQNQYNIYDYDKVKN